MDRASKKIGLIGGVSPESTVFYYRLINQAAARRLGRPHSAEVIIYALDFGTMMKHYTAEDWPSFKAEVVRAGRALEAAGCDALAISSNTTQMAVFDLADAVGAPVINMLTVLGNALTDAGVQRPLVLGTPFVMEGDFYRPHLEAIYGLKTIIPGADDRREVDRVIFEELVNGVISPEARRSYIEIIARGAAAGADAVILGCTEIGLLIEQDHARQPVFDTTRLHAAAIAEFAFSERPAS